METSSWRQNSATVIGERVNHPRRPCHSERRAALALRPIVRLLLRFAIHKPSRLAYAPTMVLVNGHSSPAIQASWAPQRTAVVLHVNLLPSMLGVGSSTFGVCSPSLALRPSLPFSELITFSCSLVIRTWTFSGVSPLPWPALGVAHWPLGFAALVLAPGIHALRSDAVQAPRPVMRRPSVDRRSCLSFSIVRQTIAFPLHTRWFDVNVVSKFRRRGNIPHQTHRRACGEETTSYRSSIESFGLIKDACPL